VLVLKQGDSPGFRIKRLGDALLFEIERLQRVPDPARANGVVRAVQVTEDVVALIRRLAEPR
jgi:hypothetical protein